MARAIRFHPLFDCDVREAAGWYDRRSPTLGDQFADAVERTLRDIIADPQRFALTSVGCRSFRLPRFPYVVLFDVTESELNFFAVLHTARSMEKWRERIEKA
jgi:hypothetical protein